jgi:hypothetical protein
MGRGFHKYLALLEETGIPFVGTYFDSGTGLNMDYVGTFGAATPDDPVQKTTPTANFVTGPQLNVSETQVAYVDASELYVVSWPAGGDETKIVDASTHGSVDSCWWSPDGTTIIYCVSDTTTTSLFTVAPDGTGDTTIYTDGSARNVSGPSYNYDGSLIAFHVLLSAATFGVFVANSDGTGAAQVGTNSPTQFSGLYFQIPMYSWGNASNVIAYGGGTLAAPTMRVVNSDGTGDTLLGSTIVGQGRPTSRRFTQDDTGVYYLANARKDIRKFAADGSGDSLIYSGSLVHGASMFDVGGTVFVTEDDGVNPTRIYAMSEDGSTYTQRTSGTDDVTL